MILKQVSYQNVLSSLGVISAFYYKYRNKPMEIGSNRELNYKKGRLNTAEWVLNDDTYAGKIFIDMFQYAEFLCVDSVSNVVLFKAKYMFETNDLRVEYIEDLFITDSKVVNLFGCVSNILGVISENN